MPTEVSKRVSPKQNKTKQNKIKLVIKAAGTLQQASSSCPRGQQHPNP
jgi:hypothetical protein